MEVIGFAFVVGLLIRFIERRDRARMYPPQPCKYCHQWISLHGYQWVHDDGEIYARYEIPPLDYDNFPDTPLHAASPSSVTFLSTEEEAA